jgi:hypothetical protein
MIAMRPRPIFLTALISLAAGCGGDGPSDPGDPEQPPVASIRIISGDGQTAPTGAVLPTPVVIEVLDINGQGSSGRTLVLTEAGFEPALNYQSDDPSGVVVTDEAGRAELTWTIYGLVGTRHLIASVLGSAVVGKDTITATVIPASPSQVTYIETEVYRLLGEPADLAANIVSVKDSWDNPVAIQTLSVQAPNPLVVSGQATVTSTDETDTSVNLMINGVSFPQRVVVLRSVLEFSGAVGDWTCSVDPGTPVEPAALKTQVGRFAVDSVTRYGDYGSAWTLHTTTTLHRTFGDGHTEEMGPTYGRRYVLLQFPHGFLFPYGPQMDQIGVSPVTYREDGNYGPSECLAWGSPSSSHVLLTMTLTH